MTRPDRIVTARVVSGLLAKIKGSRTALIVAAEYDPDIQEILSMVNQLEIKLTIYIANDMDRLERDGDNQEVTP